MKRIKLLILLSSLGFFWQCQKDDICPEATQSTPLLIIRFMDVEDPEAAKNVPSLTVKANSEEENFITRTTTDSIAIPLKTFENLTEYTFIKNDPVPPAEGEEDPEDISNTDQLIFTYAVEQIYLNRACGYIVNYTINNITVGAEPLPERWIRGIIVEQTNINNETTAHLTILH